MLVYVRHGQLVIDRYFRVLFHDLLSLLLTYCYSPVTRFMLNFNASHAIGRNGGPAQVY